MAQNKERPNVFVTAICENVLEEKDGVLSAIRFIDRVQGSLPSDVPDEVVIPVKVAILVMMWAGDARGKRLLSLSITNPKGETVPAGPPVTLVFTEEYQGGNTIMRIVAGLTASGRYMFNVMLDDEIISRLPLEMTLTREEPAEPTTPNV